MGEAQATKVKLAIDEIHKRIALDWTIPIHCLICHRKLTNPKSIERRMGDICFTKFNKGCRGIQQEIKV